MFPLVAITWRLGYLDSDQYETIIPSKTQRNKVFEELSTITKGVYFLETCQRTIIVIESQLAWLIDDVINKYFQVLNTKKTAILEPEVFLGLDALIHLAKVVSGLDSVVLGEYEIQHQFKDAYDNSQQFMSGNLKTYMQYIIKIGKRVRQKSQLDKTSTIEAVETIFHESFQDAKSIGLIGTGKMGQLCIKYLTYYHHKMKLFTTLNDRVGEEISGFCIRPLNELRDVDVLISVTAKSKFIDKEFLNSHNLVKNCLIVDLGMPRNCNQEIYEVNEIEIVDIERLVEMADATNRIKHIGEAMSLIEDQVNHIIKEYQHQLRSKIIVDLRSDLYSFARGNKPEFVGDTNLKTYNQFVNAMIHISQKHIEKVIFEGPMTND